MSCPDGVRRPGGPVRLAARRTSAGAAGGATGCVARVASLDTRGPASRARAAPRGRRADERDADAGVRRRKSVDARDPPPPPPAARPRAPDRGPVARGRAGGRPGRDAECGA